MENRGENIMTKDKLLAVGERYEAMIAPTRLPMRSTSNGEARGPSARRDSLLRLRRVLVVGLG